MALVGPSGGQLLLRLLSGLSHLLSSCLFSSSHTSRGIAEFHVSDFRHDDDYFLGLFLGFFPMARSIARPTGLRATPSFVPIAVPNLRTEGVAAASKVPATGPPIRPAPARIAIGFGVAAGDIGRRVVAAGALLFGFRTGFFGRLGRRGD